MKEKIPAILLIAVAVVLFACGGYLFYQTLGTTLLFTSTGLGKWCKFYWIFWLVGVVVLGMGVLMLKKTLKNTGKEPVEQPEEEKNKK